MAQLDKVVALLWPVLLLALLWLVVGMLALIYARATRRPIFLFSGLAALLLVVEHLLSPGRVFYHYLNSQPVYGGQRGRLDLLFGAYKYEWLVDGLAATLLLAGIIWEVVRARRRAARNHAARAASLATLGTKSAAEIAPASTLTQASSHPGDQP